MLKLHREQYLHGFQLLSKAQIIGHAASSPKIESRYVINIDEAVCADFWFRAGTITETREAKIYMPVEWIHPLYTREAKQASTIIRRGGSFQPSHKEPYYRYDWRDVTLYFLKFDEPIRGTSGLWLRAEQLV